MKEIFALLTTALFAIILVNLDTLVHTQFGGLIAYTLACCALIGIFDTSADIYDFIENQNKDSHDSDITT